MIKRNFKNSKEKEKATEFTPESRKFKKKSGAKKQSPYLGFGGGVEMTREPPLQLLHKGRHRRVPRVQQQDLLRSDDGLYVFQIDDDRPLTTEDRGRVREERVQDPKVAGGETRPAHDGVLAGLHHLGLPGRVEEKPCPDASPLLAEGPGGGEREVVGGGAGGVGFGVVELGGLGRVRKVAAPHGRARISASHRRSTLELDAMIAHHHLRSYMLYSLLQSGLGKSIFSLTGRVGSGPTESNRIYLVFPQNIG